MDNKQKNEKVNRILYVSMVLVLCAVATIIAITSSVNRARRDSIETPPVTDTTASPSTDTPATLPARPDTTKKSEDTKIPDTNAPETTATVTPGDGNYEDVDLPAPALPTFFVPVKGEISKSHDGEQAVYSATMGDYRVHLGIDISCNIGDRVNAAADGTVSQIWDDPLMGKCVSVSHTGAGLSIYKNLSPELPSYLAVGSKVSAGEAIGTVGESAIIEIADEPHLHFELTVGGVHVDPMEYFSPASVSASIGVKQYE